MAKAVNKDRLNQITSVIEANPQGVKPGRIARLLGLHRSTVNRALPHLEDKGVLLSEDNKGRLSVFKRRQ